MPDPAAAAPPTRRERRVDLGLTVLLLLQGFTLFVAIPLGGGSPLGRVLLDGCHLSFALLCTALLTRHRGVQAVLIASLVLLVGGPLVANAIGGALRLPAVVQHELIAMAAFAFNAVVTALVGRHVFTGGRVTVHRVRGAILLYLNVAALFAIAYGLIDALDGGAFARTTEGAGAGAAFIPASFSYFSLTTITTTGFGDIVPVHPLARSLATLEAVFGQLFPATLLARLVSLHVAAERAGSDTP